MDRGRSVEGVAGQEVLLGPGQLRPDEQRKDPAGGEEE
jgi:hypothetical protein